MVDEPRNNSAFFGGGLVRSAASNATMFFSHLAKDADCASTIFAMPRENDRQGASLFEYS
jgi:hypothetical protein